MKNLILLLSPLLAQHAWIPDFGRQSMSWPAGQVVLNLGPAGS